MKLPRLLVIILFFVAGSAAALFSQPDVANFRATIINNPEPGYIFLAPYTSTKLAILDNTGVPVYSKDFANPTKILDFKYRFGKLWYANGLNTFYYYVLDENLNMLDSITTVSPYYPDFHDMQPLENGHVLLLSMDIRHIDMSKIVPGGQTSALVNGFVILELDENKNVVFTWNTFDHFNITDATSDVDLTESNILPFHCNSIELDNDGNLLLSSRHMDEITKINRSNGQIMWRLGGKNCRNNQFRFTNDTINNYWGFSHQHDVRRLPNGHLLLMDNGNLKPTPYSRVVEYEINENNRTITKVWEYRNSPDIFSPAMGSAQRLPNGDTFIGWGVNDDNIIATEVTPDGTKAYEAVSDNISLYRAVKFVFKMDAVTRNVSSAGNYSFNESDNETQVSLSASSVSNNGRITVEKHSYQARNPSFSSASNPLVLYNYRWMVTKSGSPSLTGTLNFNMASLPEIPDPSQVRIYKRNNEGSGEFALLSTSYNANNNEISVPFSGFGEYIMASNNTKAPDLVSPSKSTIGNSINVTLSWDSCFSASSYWLQVSGNKDFSDFFTNENSITGTSYTCKDLPKNSTVYWRVKAKYFNGSSDWSEVWDFVPKVDPPTLVSPHNMSKGEPINPIFIWTSVPFATSYNVQVSQDTSFKLTLVNLQGLTDVSLNCPNLKSNNTYYWRVSATSTGGTSGWSETWSFDTKLYPPVLLVPADKSAGLPESGSVSWQKVTGAEFYRIQIDTSDKFLQPVVDESGLTTLNYYYKDLRNNRRYFWRVRATCYGEKTEWSAVNSFTVIIAPPKPLLPVQEAKSQPVNGLLVWEPSNGAKFCKVQLASDSLFANMIFSQDSLLNTSYPYNELENNTNYFWRVNATDTGGTSRWSEVMRFKTKFNSNFTIPVLTHPANNAEPVLLSDSLAWVTVKGADKYRIQIASNPSFNLNLKEDETTDSVLMLSDLSNFTEYYWHVQAIFPGGEGDWSPTRKLRTIIGQAHLQYPADGSEDVNLEDMFSWDPVKGANNYAIQISLSSDFADNNILWEFEDIYDTKIQCKMLDSKTQYYWRIRAIRNQEYGDWSTSFGFMTADMTSVEKNECKNDNLYINFYPNPSSYMSLIKINVEKASFVTLKIYYPDGSEALCPVSSHLNPGSYSYNWDCSRYPAGSYFYRLTDGEKTLNGVIINVK